MVRAGHPQTHPSRLWTNWERRSSMGGRSCNRGHTPTESVKNSGSRALRPPSNRWIPIDSCVLRIHSPTLRFKVKNECKEAELQGKKMIPILVKAEKCRMAPEVGLEPTTDRLTADCSTIELLWNPDEVENLRIWSPFVNSFWGSEQDFFCTL